LSAAAFARSLSRLSFARSLSRLSLSFSFWERSFARSLRRRSRSDFASLAASFSALPPRPEPADARRLVDSELELAKRAVVVAGPKWAKGARGAADEGEEGRARARGTRDQVRAVEGATVRTIEAVERSMAVAGALWRERDEEDEVNRERKEDDGTTTKQRRTPVERVQRRMD